MTTPMALTYSEYPKWLNHKQLSPVIVYNAEQEAQHISTGYFAPGTSDPHGYLVAKATEKMDDAIRTMNADVERKVKAGLVDLYNRLVKAMKEEIRMTKIRDRSSGYKEAVELENDITSMQTKFVDDIMDSIRASAKGTN